MTHAATVFRISDLETGRVLGESVVCTPSATPRFAGLGANVRHAATHQRPPGRMSTPNSPSEFRLDRWKSPRQLQHF